MESGEKPLILESVHVPPNLWHFLSNVYEPAEDTFLLLDAIQQDLLFLKAARPCICLEVGCGTGTVIASVVKFFGNSMMGIATDINPAAAKLTRELTSGSGILVDAVLGDLAVPLQTRLRNLVDVLIFNPPYVVTPSDEVGSRGIQASWAGGTRGREVIDRFLPSVENLLSSRGVFYMVVLKENDPEEIVEIMKGHGLRGTAITTRRCGREFLTIMRFDRFKPP